MSLLALPLHTARLTLHPVVPGDAPFFERLYADWRVAQYLLRTPAPFTPAHAQSFVATAIAGIQEGHTYTLIITQDDTTPVGLISLRVPAADQGADIYAASCFITPGGYATDAGLLAGYAQEHRMAVLLANYGAPTGGWAAAGRSAIWSREGEVIACGPAEGEAVVVARLEDAPQSRTRHDHV